MSKRIEQSPWEKECNKFHDWYKALGGNVSNNAKMTEAYLKIKY